MIKYNNNTINDWDFGTSNIKKVYRNNSVCYYKVSGTPPSPTSQTPCFAVVDDISQYQDTEFEDVFNNADEKWYKLNNLNQYEEYGVYGSGRTITTYDGKLTIDGDYEYIYSGNTWVNLGEVSGSTVELPDVPFTVNYNAKNHNDNILLKTNGQLADTDVTISGNTLSFHNDYVTVPYGSRGVISGYDSYFNRTNMNPTLTIISKQQTNGSDCHLFANRTSDYNWMYRTYSNRLTLHGGNGESGILAVTTQPVIESVRVNNEQLLTYNNYTDDTTASLSNFSYGSTNTGGTALFAGYTMQIGEYFSGDFYWIYMSQSCLTDEQVQQVIDYNESVATSIYPMYYTAKQDPPNNISFSSMTEAEEYVCPWVGMEVTIDGVPYVFAESGDTYYWEEETV